MATIGTRIKQRKELWLNLALVFLAISFCVSIWPAFPMLPALYFKARYEPYPEYVPTLEDIERVTQLQAIQTPVYEKWPEVRTVAYRNGEWTKIILSKKRNIWNFNLDILITSYVLTVLFFILFLVSKFSTSCSRKCK